MGRSSKGFTLIELVVTITILVIFISIVSLSVYPSYSANAKRCAAQTDALISKCRLGVLSRTGNVHLTIHSDLNGNIIGDYYEADSTPISTDTLADKKVSMAYTLKNTDGTSRTTNISAAPLVLSFNRSTGEFKAQSDGSYCTAITISCGGKTYTITLVPSTGTHTTS